MLLLYFRMSDTFSLSMTRPALVLKFSTVCTDCEKPDGLHYFC